MEREIGEVFNYDGKKLKVVETKGSTCYNCYFADRDCDCMNTRKILGACVSEIRTDHKPVIFVEVKEEPEEQPKLNLCEILKNCPEGTELWSDNYGKVRFLCIEKRFDEPIVTRRTDGCNSTYTKEGWYSINFPASCLLWPSKNCRDWSKFTAPWLKKEKFDPKTLKPFDRIIVRNDSERWLCTIFSYIGEGCYPYNTVSGNYAHCIPYNDDTKHLVGTKDEAPEFYKYWED